MKPIQRIITIPKDAWHDRIACVTVDGVTSDVAGKNGRQDQLIRVFPTNQQFEWNVHAVASSFNTLIFKCNIVPTRDVQVVVHIEKRNPRIRF